MIRFPLQRSQASAVSPAGVGVLAAVVLSVAGSAAHAAPVQDWVRTEVRADCSNYNPLRAPFFGDTHVHTKYSADAALARTRNDPYHAYDFATGGTVGLPPYDAFDVPGREATIDRPLDFGAVTDHSEGFGEARICLEPGYGGYSDPLCQSIRDSFLNVYQPTNELPEAFVEFFQALTFPNPSRFPGICGDGPGYADCLAEAGLVWQDTQDAAEAYYDTTDACTFTTFHAYEWSGQTAGNNLHRNIIFRNAEVPAMPISYYEKWKPEDMRAELKLQCLDAPGNCDVLAIPHNSNLANDKMFFNRTTDNAPFTVEYAELRASMEPIMELSQVKGESECRAGVVGTTDELCNFENNTTANIISGKLANHSDFSQYAYARGALKRGLSLERQLGVNPFALGFIGSTDTHNGIPGAVSEVDYGGIGSTGVADSSPAFILADATQPSKVEQNPGGLAVVWAEENSRDALFAAMRRRETYSTSGTRPILRVFGGRPPLDLCENVDLDFVEEGYDKGVPMGGDIGPVFGKRSPRFAIQALKDPGGLSTPLQRAQIIKGWIDDKGFTHETVYEVAGNPDNGAGVNLDTCAETGTGFDSLCAVWEDPDFDPTENAFYYVRVVENPVCRWHKRLCNSLRTCSILLTSCSLDPSRTCTSDAECEAHDAGSTCTTDYPAVCVTDADCEVLGAGTCGATPAVDCGVPASVPPAATECCDQEGNPWTIQERAVASPIWYHANRMGMEKGKVGFKDTVGEDKLQLGMIIFDAPSELDPAVNDLALTLRDDGTVWTASIPAATMEVKKPGRSYKYKDKTGAISGITGLSVKISAKGVAKIKVKTGEIDLSGLSRENQTLALDFVSGTYSSTSEREWTFKSPKLSLVR
ncbi:MAG: DUF3604 domain-containing protein [Candidatus Binatia bacterium]